MNKKQLQNVFRSFGTLKRRIDQGHYDFCEIWEVGNTPAGCKGVLKIFDMDRIPKSMLTEDGTVQEIAYRKKLNSYVFGKVIKTGEKKQEGVHVSYILSKYIPNVQRLSDYLRRFGTLKRSRKTDDILELTWALQELSEATQGGGHYNVCPENILINSEGIYLTGMTHLGAPTSGNPALGIEHLALGYRPQENFLGIFNFRTDIYSFSLVLCQMLSGKYPFGLDNPNALVTPEGKKLLKSAKQQGAELDSLDEKIQTFVKNALEKKFKDLSEMNDSLGIALGVGKIVLVDEMTEMTEEEKEDEKNKVCEVGIEKKEGSGFAQVAGMEPLKKRLSRDFVKVIQNKNLAQTYGITPPNIILYGPPGCGKTFIANRLAEETGINYSYIKPSDLGSTYVHGTQGKIADLFKKAEKQAPCLLCIDEIDSLLAKRSMSEERNNSNDEIAEWLTQLNNCTERGIYVVGMTNRISALDEAVIRKGRFDATFYVPLPDEEERKQLFRLSLGKCPSEEQINMNSLARMTERYSSSDIVSMVKEASREAFEMTLEKKSSTPILVTQKMLEDTIKKTRPSVSSSSMKLYEQERERFEHGNDNRKLIGFK